MNREARAIESPRTPSQCRAIINTLDRSISGEAAAELDTEVSDDVLRAAFDNERRALGGFLTSCVQHIGTATSLEKLRVALATTAEVVDARLRTLGIAS